MSCTSWTPTAKNQRRLTDAPDSYEWGATWSPDGQRIAFISTRDFSETRGGGLSQIYVMNADGSNPLNLNQDDYLNTYSSWSPDGYWLAFVSDRSGNWDIWKLDVRACLEAREEGVDGEDPRCQPVQLTDNPDDDFYPRWSPDGDRIAFESRRQAVRDIYVMDADGGNVTKVTADIDDDSTPMWALDGKAIIYSSYKNFDWDLYSINVDGSDLRQLTKTKGEERFGDWRP